jgi:hypothetical protein
MEHGLKPCKGGKFNKGEVGEFHFLGAVYYLDKGVKVTLPPSAKTVGNDGNLISLNFMDTSP